MGNLYLRQRDANGQVDSAGGNVLSMTQVFRSEVDSEQGSTETDDVAYSTGPTADLPKGLLLTETYPLGRVTTYSYRAMSRR